MLTPINPAYTAREITDQLRDSRAVRLVTVAPLLEAAFEGAEGTEVRHLDLLGSIDQIPPNWPNGSVPAASGSASSPS